MTGRVRELIFARSMVKRGTERKLLRFGQAGLASKEICTEAAHKTVEPRLAVPSCHV